MNVEREIGGAMDEYYTTAKPSMDQFDCLLRCDVLGNHVIVGEQIHDKDLSRRCVHLAAVAVAVVVLFVGIFPSLLTIVFVFF